jgi:hypothetical protein
MEATLMAIVAAPEASLASLLHMMRGEIVDAGPAYPDVLHVEVRDRDGDSWHLGTLDAQWSPSKPTELVGRAIEDVDLDEETGRLRCKLSDGTVLDVRPTAREADDDPPNWELITPGGVVLEFGPGVRWQISGADGPASARR